MPRTEVVERVVEISDNVTIEIANRKSKVAGPKGTLPYSMPKGGVHASRHVLDLERRFVQLYEDEVRWLCDFARNSCHLAHNGLELPELQSVSSVPVASFPMGSMNACVCGMSAGDRYINISPELLMGLRIAYEITATHYARRIDLNGATAGNITSFESKTVFLCYTQFGKSALNPDDSYSFYNLAVTEG
jgi:hypothetical protein